MYYQLIYVSRRPLNISRFCFGSIIKACENNNRKNGITGLLLSESRHFFQVLEGPEASVKSLFSHISTDQRHTDIQVYLERENPQRDFAEWWMAFREIDTIDTSGKCLELTRDRVMRRALVEADDIMHGLVMDFLALCKAPNRGDIEMFEGTAA